ncbi:YcfL family protein [Sodalis ligni]|uniref:Uncharacterized protein YcfL n=1 Tax=Sodalis ligni TaxID=2697027 RepID=A0A4R1NA98_9GAMM|nr:DUF1425 domain-containing protein [Sodalis ligni]TCL03627.1 uncharacterized protein YcfL [Sodalis ligni]
MRFARFAPSLLAGLLLAAGCSSGGHKTLMINNQQSLVMDLSVMTAGINAQPPSIGDVQGQKRAAAVIHNDQSHPVTLHYRFYWYDRQGLDILPYASVQTLVIPPGATVTVDATSGNLEARQVRLYLYI